MKDKQTKITAEPGKQHVYIERGFDAPKELVFRAFTEPELITRWMSMEDQTCTIDKLDNRSGGEWRFIHTDCDGNEAAFHGVIHELCEPERVIRTFEFEGLPERGHVALETLTLNSLPGEKTKIVIHSVFKSLADRDGFIQSGAEKGIIESHNNLDKLLVDLR